MFAQLLLIGYGVTLLCKKIVLVIYCLQPQLRNLQGQIFICHYVSECVFSTLFLVRASGLSFGLREIAFSVLLAYFFLATFTWLALLNVELCLSAFRRPGSTLGLRGFLLYFFVGWAEPATTLALDYYVVSGASLTVFECVFKALLTAALSCATAWKISRIRSEPSTAAGEFQPRERESAAHEFSAANEFLPRDSSSVTDEFLPRDRENAAPEPPDAASELQPRDPEAYFASGESPRETREAEDTRGFFLHTKLALIVGLMWLAIQLLYVVNLAWPRSSFEQCLSVIIAIMVVKDVILFISLVRDKLVIKGFSGL